MLEQTKLIQTRSSGFGVYVHWPFCQSKCPYCDFNSHVRRGGVDEARFLKAYLRELEWHAAHLPAEKVKSIFFGGGTPSLMAPKTVGTILEAINAHWGFEDGIEISLEANPTSVEAERFRGYASAGVNRVSLGVQALNDPDLKALGRLHNVDEAMAALDIAEATFDRFSFDLIYARPNQTVEAWQDELAQALKRGAGHMSLYQLTIEPETPFWALHKAGKLKIPEPELGEQFYQITQELCQAAGLKTYEISNHAKPGEECRHNLIYWQYGRYAGIGPGAHGRISLEHDQQKCTRFCGSIMRQTNNLERIPYSTNIDTALERANHATSTERNPEAWLAMVEDGGHGMIEREEITNRQQADEMLLMGLRLEAGLDLGRLCALTGYSIDPSTITELTGDGLLAYSPGDTHLRASPRGRVVLNGLILNLSENLVKACR